LTVLGFAYDLQRRQGSFPFRSVSRRCRFSAPVILPGATIWRSIVETSVKVTAVSAPRLKRESRVRVEQLREQVCVPVRRRLLRLSLSNAGQISAIR
jgi:hypothetical protein